MNETKKFPSLSVIIPVYNEENTIDKIFNLVSAQNLVSEIVIVDDCSKDKSVEKINNNINRLLEVKPELKVAFLKNKKNQGKGSALRKGFQHATSDIIVIQDADLEYNPKEYLALIQPIIDGDADVVYGSRFIGGTHRVLYFWHYFGNKILTLLSNMFSNLNLTDMETCYKMFRREILETIDFKSNRFGFEPEFTAKVAKANLRIYEIPISYYGRTYDDGKKITWRDGIAAVFHIIRFNLFS
ncbi:MAG: glycosyl transferase [Candidatus Marinimicrobia bacterium]|nr:glycosyl transferase [Candidatus Neomarinimicrobiota bacterium]|tara:strand:- start:66138 stop:66863 length:726 start_codon:yes stop_codon:yes gene_type:complete